MQEIHWIQRKKIPMDYFKMIKQSGTIIKPIRIKKSAVGRNYLSDKPVLPSLALNNLLSRLPNYDSLGPTPPKARLIWSDFESENPMQEREKPQKALRRFNENDNPPKVGFNLASVGLLIPLKSGSVNLLHEKRWKKPSLGFNRALPLGNKKLSVKYSEKPIKIKPPRKPKTSILWLKLRQKDLSQVTIKKADRSIKYRVRIRKSIRKMIFFIHAKTYVYKNHKMEAGEATYNCKRVYLTLNIRFHRTYRNMGKK